MGNPTNFLKHDASPWQPEQDKLMLALLGKHIEELSECAAISARCVIQGIDEREPVTHLLNREELENELADVQATTHLLVVRLGLNRNQMELRKWAKAKHLGGWHLKLEEGKVTKPLDDLAERIYDRVSKESFFVEKSSYTLETLKRVLAEELK
jgi:hypothetical protein